jgi:hypothetical protein
VGDARQPYSDRGGPEGRHAETHDVRREEATRAHHEPQERDEFALDLESEASGGGHVDESFLATDDKALRAQLRDFDADDLKRISLLTVGTRLEQGSTYVDLNDPARVPFKALGDQEAGADNRYVAKRDTDYEMWDRLVGQGRPAEIERPGEHA